MLRSLLSITHGSIFAGNVAEFLRELHRNEQYATAASIHRLMLDDQELKGKYLEYLRTKCGMNGVYSLLSTVVSPK